MHDQPHALYPAAQTTLQAEPLQMAVPFAGGGGQTTHDDPHAVTLVFEAQVLPHAWNPGAQMRPHTEPLQVALPLGGTGQAVQEVPQELTLLFDTHMPPQL